MKSYLYRLIIDDICDLSFKIRGLLNEIKYREGLTEINPDADYTAEINACKYSIRHFSKQIKDSKKHLKTFRKIAKGL